MLEWQGLAGALKDLLVTSPREPYREMSDAELTAELRKHLPDRSWTLAHMVELERRGFDSIASDAELHRAVVEDYEAMREKLQKAFEPAMERFKSIGGLADRWTHLVEQFGAAATPHGLLKVKPPPLEIPRAGEISALEPSSGPISITEPDFDPIVDRLAKNAELRAEQREQELAVQVDQLQVLRTMQIEIERSNQRDWFDWVVFACVVVAAIGAAAAVGVGLHFR